MPLIVFPLVPVFDPSPIQNWQFAAVCIAAFMRQATRDSHGHYDKAVGPTSAKIQWLSLVQIPLWIHLVFAIIFSRSNYTHAEDNDVSTHWQMHVAVWSKMINTWFGTVQIYWIGTVFSHRVIWSGDCCNHLSQGWYSQKSTPPWSLT